MVSGPWVIWICPEVSWMVPVTFGAKSITTGPVSLLPSTIAWRRLPGPLSLLLVTVKSVAGSGVCVPVNAPAPVNSTSVAKACWLVGSSSALALMSSTVNALTPPTKPFAVKSNSWPPPTGNRCAPTLRMKLLLPMPIGSRTDLNSGSPAPTA